MRYLNGLVGFVRSGEEKASGEVADLGEQTVGWSGEVQGMADDLYASVADDMDGGLAAARGVDEVSARQVERGAVGEQLVEVRVRVAGRLLGLVLDI